MSAPQNNFVTVSRRPPDVEDYIDMMRRYRSWIIGPMFLGLVISTVIAFYHDDTFVSRATMRITPQVVSEKLVQNTSSTLLSQRVEQITTTILSHTNLITLIQAPDLNLYPKDRANGKALEDVATDMAKDIKLVFGTPVDVGDRRMAASFTITFSYNDRIKAQKVVGKLVSMYEEQNVMEQRNQAKTTSTFLGDQLKQAQDHLAAVEQAIAKFNMENRGHLPQEYQNNISQAQSLHMQMYQVQDQINNLTNNKVGYESHLKYLQAQERTYTEGLVTQLPGQSGYTSAAADGWRKRVADLKTQLAAAQKEYKDTMPEVKNYKDAIDFAQGQLDAQEKQDAERAKDMVTAPQIVRNPQMAQLLETTRSEISTVKTQMAQAENNIELKQKQLDELTKESANVQRAIDASGSGSAEYDRLEQERGMAQLEVQDATKKAMASTTQERMEDAQAGEKLETLDMASLPETATEPKREVWAGIGTLLGLMVGLVLAGAKEMKNTSLKNLKDVRAYTNLPVLSSIPLLENALLVRRKRRLFWLAWTSAFIVGMACISASMYYHFVLRA